MRSFAMVLALMSGSAIATPMSFTNAIVTIKATPDTNGSVTLLLNRSVAEWCTGAAHGIEIDSYEAGLQFDSMAVGVYNCTGGFVQQPGFPRTHIFNLGPCTPANVTAMTSSCHGVR